MDKLRKTAELPTILKRTIWVVEARRMDVTNAYAPTAYSSILQSKATELRRTYEEQVAVALGGEVRRVARVARVREYKRGFDDLRDPCTWVVAYFIERFHDHFPSPYAFPDREMARKKARELTVPTQIHRYIRVA